MLEAIRWHTLGSAHWGRTGKALYMADFLGPGRPFLEADRAFLAAHATTDFDAVFRQVVRTRIEWTVREGKMLFPETADLWNTRPMTSRADCLIGAVLVAVGWRRRRDLDGTDPTDAGAGRPLARLVAKKDSHGAAQRTGARRNHQRDEDPRPRATRDATPARPRIRCRDLYDEPTGHRAHGRARPIESPGMGAARRPGVAAGRV